MAAAAALTARRPRTARGTTRSRSHTRCSSVVWHGDAFQDWLYLLAYQQKLQLPHIRPDQSELHSHAGHVHHQRQRRDGRGRRNHHLHRRLDHCEQLGELLIHRPRRLVWHGHAHQDRLYLFACQSKLHQRHIQPDQQNYTATLIGYTISGNAGVGSATITYTGGSTTANSSGDYSFTVSPGWSGTVTPSRTGFAFSPASRTYTNVTANQTAQNYTARPTVFTFGSFGDAHNEPYFTTTANQLASLNPALVLCER